MNFHGYKKIFFLICAWSTELFADQLVSTIIYVPNCNECYKLCNQTYSDTDTNRISNCQCGGISTLSQTGFSTNLTLSGTCGDSTCSVDDLQATLKNAMNTCTYTTTTTDNSDSNDSNNTNNSDTTPLAPNGRIR